MEMLRSPFEIETSQLVWDSRYRYAGVAGDQCIGDSWRRVARALAGIETSRDGDWEARFFDLLDGFQFLPGGRILAGAGTDLDVTLFNCFVMGPIADSMEGIFDALKEGALTMQKGGGVGYDFSTLRPAGTPAMSVGSRASGPVSFMRIWNGMCETLLSSTSRRGAMMATLRCDHPDIEEFIDAKRKPGELTNFNLSVLVSDACRRWQMTPAGHWSFPRRRSMMPISRKLGHRSNAIGRLTRTWFRVWCCARFLRASCGGGSCRPTLIAQSQVCSLLTV